MAPRPEDCDQCREECSRTVNDLTYSDSSSSQVSREEEIRWEETVKYLGVTSDKRLTWSSHIDQVRGKASQRLVLLGPLLNKRSGVMQYRQLIRPMMDYACPVCRHAADSHLKRLQHVQSKCLRIIAGAPWYASNLQLHEDLEVPYIYSRTHQESCTEFRL